MFLLRLTSVRLPTAPTATTDITHTPAHPTATTGPHTSIAAFLSARVRGSTASTAAITDPAIVISAATTTAHSGIVTGSAIFVVGVTSMGEDSVEATDSAAMVISMAVDSAAGVSSTVAADPMVVAASTAAARAEADIADHASTFCLCTKGWRPPP